MVNVHKELMQCDELLFQLRICAANINHGSLELEQRESQNK